MRFIETPLEGVVVIESEAHKDERGSFARIWCAKEFAEHGLNSELVQCSLSRNHLAGTVRGMHFQSAPHEETKVVRCVSGALFDVALDLRKGSGSFGQWFAAELNDENGRALYVPPGVAHGFQTLTDNTSVLYQISDWFVPESASGVRWDDPAFGIDWPLACSVISNKDATYPLFSVSNAGLGDSTRMVNLC